MNIAKMIIAAGSLSAMTTAANAVDFSNGLTDANAPETATSAPLNAGFDTNFGGRVFGGADDGLVLNYDRDDRRRNGRRGNRGRGNNRDYDDRGRYNEPRRLGHRDRIWRGRGGEYYCERDNGTTGLVIGAGLGALAGRAIDTQGDRTVGTILGAIAGGAIGREIDRGELRCH